MKVQKREDDFLERRSHLKDLSDEQLKEKFWGLIEQVVDPLLDLANKNTTVSIERSVLLRMGFSSIEVSSIVENVQNAGLLEYGAGHVVYLASKLNNIDIRTAGLAIIDEKYLDQVKKELK
ncbi:MAG: ornithine aminomutase subunit alpha [Bacilli bacterium]